ncbi:DsbA family oxidoreductase [Altererythrobacter sp. KTW20L]|uniref:DsbA family oxidoreductase n=1 Tax=Altererythrobacter sp. KTW20L TaxID=2942210 RepID=UPI0020BDB95F|nr:DsbA family oxidoreductase [Altererythrobacter sp. KTW20L]MCL6250618.1 DsbA family oxidoreductase [Altererythrobacter sp. KTW20L]
MTDKLVVDVWSDVMCPWCAIGFTQFSRAIEDLAGDVEVETRFMPFELNPDMASEGRGQAELLAENYSKTLEEVAEMRATVEAAAEAAGFPMDWRGIEAEPPRWVWNTHEAHMLLRWTLAVAGSEVQTALKVALFKAYFQQRLDVSDRAVLLELAEELGLDRAKAAEALDDPALSTAIRMEEQRAAENGIRSVPTYVVNGKYILQGSSDPESYRQALTKLASMEAMA